jgi:hypothetical protein
MPEDARSDLERQVRLSKLLVMGFALSFHGVAGLGSLAGLLIGLKGLRAINRSPNELSGKWMAWWCVIAGGVGTVGFLPFTLLLFIRPDK